MSDYAFCHYFAKDGRRAKRNGRLAADGWQKQLATNSIGGFRLVQSFGFAQDKSAEIEPISTPLIPNDH